MPDEITLDQEQGHGRVAGHFATFQRLIDQADRYVRAGRYDAAAVQAEIAANYAMCRHPGLFVSPRLERCLLTIGRATIRSGRPVVARPDGPRRMLHVFTQVAGIGGHTRMLWRWIQQDAERCHSVVVTRQGAAAIPAPLRETVAGVGGTIRLLNWQRGSLIDWAQRLRDIASTADAVVLHVHPFDVIPILAFADQRHGPPILYLDHADQVFWVGTSISSIVISLRTSGQRLALDRRCVLPARSVLLPIVLDPVSRTLTRPEAKRRLGLDEDSIVLLSIARPHKYRPVGDASFVDSLLPILQRQERTVLVVVGPEATGEWQQARQQLPGRIRVVPQHEDTAVFYQAADIYLDSFPIASNTSLLEAGSYGLPLVTYCPYGPASEVLGADMPGLDGKMIRAQRFGDYLAAIARLVVDEAYRQELGTQTRQAIAAVHSGAGWKDALQALYARVADVAPPLDLSASDQAHDGEPDALVAQLFRYEPDLAEIIQFHLRVMPLDLRLQSWTGLLSQRRRFLPGLLLPEWLGTRVEAWRSSRVGTPVPLGWAGPTGDARPRVGAP